ncbi:hypothetical protein NS365_20005 [Aureimonas ureilytica]|uniref:Histidine kinase n=2 Tax=Aureimonas ureilytica TaxID=401562 RepID=A0A175RJJ1_9HYPH|nr:hypothetical protein NS365_20005 [Aureimonas ureilytica]
MGDLLKQDGRYEQLSFTCPRTVKVILPHLRFDMAVVGDQMLHMSGSDLTREIQKNAAHADKPIIMVTADHSEHNRVEALQAGALEFLRKPVDSIEFITRIHNLARLCNAQRRLADRADWLRAEADVIVEELRRREEEIIHRLTLAAGYKDDDTAAHTVRMARMCAEIARELGLSPKFCRDIELAAPMHDIGKVGIPDELLLKTGKLSETEMEQMREHTRIGGEILNGSSCELLRLAAVIATSHHEWWNGEGYPEKLSGTNIPMAGRIAAVADVFDALISSRSYKRAWPEEEALEYITGQAGIQFDPDCVRAFIAVISRKPKDTDVVEYIAA